LQDCLDILLQRAFRPDFFPEATPTPENVYIHPIIGLQKAKRADVSEPAMRRE
jgi:hypothetical protein